MEIQVIMPSPVPLLAPTVDFNYDSTSTSPYATAPSSPQSTIPFTWEQKPGIPKQNNHDNQEQEEYDDVDTDFAFGKLERHSISTADDLFDGGKIKPLKPPPRLQFSDDSPRSPKSPTSRFKKALSPRSKKKDFDPFSEALKQTAREQSETDQIPPQRGRERRKTTSGNKLSRSLSPFRVSNAEINRKSSTNQSTWYNKWNLKNLLLFRSASEGSATASKDPMKKGGRNLSFRSTGSGVSVGGSSSSRRMVAAADEVNFTAVTEEVKGKANLPYKSRLLGCLRFHQNGGNLHEISRGFNTVIKQQGE